MKNTDKHSKNEASNLAPIDAIELDGVTGGCGACGQSCAAGAAPEDAASKAQNLFGATAPARA